MVRGVHVLRRDHLLSSFRNISSPWSIYLAVPTTREVLWIETEFISHLTTSETEFYELSERGHQKGMSLQVESCVEWLFHRNPSTKRSPPVERNCWGRKCEELDPLMVCLEICSGVRIDFLPLNMRNYIWKDKHWGCGKEGNTDVIGEGGCRSRLIIEQVV